MLSEKKHKKIVVDQFTISYYSFGDGQKKIALFHGFGQTHLVFSNWITPLIEIGYTVYLFDLPFHGFSTAPNKAIDKLTWQSIFLKFLEIEAIDKISLGGYSLGGRFVIATFMLMPEKIDQVYLVSPDGIYSSGWYQFATNRVSRGIFKYFMKHPDHFNRLLNLLEKWKLASPTLIKFARKELSPKDSRIRVYQSWVYLKQLKYPNNEIADQVRKGAFQLHLFLSKKDYIIPYGVILEALPHHEARHLHWLQGRHHELIDEMLLNFKIFE